MRVALVNSGIGLVGAAAALRRLRPDADLVLSMDPEGMPWGPRPVEDIVARTRAVTRAALAFAPDAVVVACNTASVHALDTLRAELEPGVPVVGTVPAVKPAAVHGERVCVWSTQATSASPYLRDLVGRWADPDRVDAVACPGLADAVDAGDLERVGKAVAAAAALTPDGVTDVVLGCTEYELVADVVAAALPPGVRLHGTADAVAAQTLRRLPVGTPFGAATLSVLLSGRPAALPEAALRYADGRLLAGLE